MLNSIELIERLSGASMTWASRLVEWSHHIPQPLVLNVRCCLWCLKTRVDRSWWGSPIIGIFVLLCFVFCFFFYLVVFSFLVRLWASIQFYLFPFIPFLTAMNMVASTGSPVSLWTQISTYHLWPRAICSSYAFLEPLRLFKIAPFWCFQRGRTSQSTLLTSTNLPQICALKTSVTFGLVVFFSSQSEFEGKSD